MPVNRKLLPIGNASELQVGQNIFHEPREHSYVILHRTMIKTESGWEYGWAYEEDNLGKVGEVYTRPDSKFDGDWWLISE